MKMNLVLYIHGKGGSPIEAEHYKKIFPDCDVIGLNYKNFTPYENADEIRRAVQILKSRYEKIILVANSIGAYFAMNAGIDAEIFKAYFISPIVDIEKIIVDLMKKCNVTEEELRRKKIIETPFDENLSWEYLSYVKTHPLKWNVPTKILYGGKDFITPLETIKNFAEKNNFDVTIMEDGEHWFHTTAQMNFLDNWIKNFEVV